MWLVSHAAPSGNSVRESTIMQELAIFRDSMNEADVQACKATDEGECARKLALEIMASISMPALLRG